MKRMLFIVVVLGLLLSAGRVSAQQLEYLGSALTPGIYDFEIAGNYAFCTFANCFRALDITNPVSITLVDDNYQPDMGRQMCANGAYAFVAGSGSKLWVFNVSSPADPEIAGVYDMGDSLHANDIFILGNYLYIACKSSGIRIIDATDPVNPLVAGSCDTPGDARGIYVAGNYAYVADLNTGMQVVDISDPLAPFIAASFVNAGDARAIAVNGNYAFIADGAAGLEIYNITDPLNPSLAGYDNSGYRAVDVAVFGNYAYLADDTLGLRIFDVADPANPSLVGAYNESMNTPNNIAFDNGRIIFAGNVQFVIIDVGTVSSPTSLGYYDQLTAFSWGWEVFDISGNIACAFDTYFGFRIVDISNPRTPLFIGEYDCPGVDFGFDFVTGGVVKDNYAYFVVSPDYFDAARLEVVDISDPANPHPETAICPMPTTETLTLRGDYIYGGAWRGLYIADISIPDQPVLVGHRERSMMDSSRPFLDGDYLYIIGWTGYYDVVYIFNISVPSDPTFVSSYSSQGLYYNDLCKRGNYLYLLCTNNSMQIINVSDPANPTLAATHENIRGGRISLVGNTACITSSDSLRLYYLSGSAAPQPMCSFPIVGGDIQIAGDKIYILGPTGLSILGISALCSQIAGDSNGDNIFNGLDIVYDVSYFKGLAWPGPCTIECGEHGTFPASSDINGDCRFNGIDVVYGVAYLKGVGSPPSWCPDCPPSGL